MIVMHGNYILAAQLSRNPHITNFWLTGLGSQIFPRLIAATRIHSPAMQRAAIGVRMHSGWGVLVAATPSAEIIERRRIDVISDNMKARQRGNQPYHRAAELGAVKAEKYLAEYTAETERLAYDAIGKTIAEMKRRGYEITAAALLLGSGHKLPPVPQILASHPLIHTAEGELFRETIRCACESLGVPVLRLPERELADRAKEVLGPYSSTALRKIAIAGRSLGPPWTADHKAAALGACIALYG
jgi:hypothetical protein